MYLPRIAGSSAKAALGNIEIPDWVPFKDRIPTNPATLFVYAVGGFILLVVAADMMGGRKRRR